MNDRKTLTKSLHTVTATVNVAAHVQAMRLNDGKLGLPAFALTKLALAMLGYGGDWSEDDATVAMICKQLRKLDIAP